MILLCKIPRYYDTYFEENSESLGLASLAAHLRINGHEAEIFDASLEGLDLRKAKERLLQLAKGRKPSIIGFTIADMTFIESTIETVAYLKEHDIGSHMTTGGHPSTFNYREILALCSSLDSVVRYEGELPLLELANALAGRREWRNILNLAYKDSEGTIRANPPMPLIPDLNQLPFPARDYLPFVRSHLPDKGVVPMSASRGCYYNCRFCSIRGFYGPPPGPLWRTRSVENIIAEIKTLKGTFRDIKEIVFVDDLFLGSSKDKTKRLTFFRDRLKENGINMLFSISDRVDNIDDEIGKIWREIGVRQILIGLESGSQEILDKLNKGITLQQQRDALQILEKYDIDPTPSFINFTPWTTLEEIQTSIKHFLDLNINLLQGLLNRVQIYDGTPLGDKLNCEGKVYGIFPNQKYRSIDKRVDNLYSILENSFGPYLEVAYRLKILERDLRFLLFDAEDSNNPNKVNVAKLSRTLYKEMMHKIMEEAVDLFSVVLNTCKNGQSEPKGRICEDISKEVTDRTNTWLRMIEVFRTFCPALEKNDKEPYYAEKRK